MEQTHGKKFVLIALTTLVLSVGLMHYLDTWPHGPNPLVRILIDLHREPTGERAFEPAPLIRLSESRGLVIWWAGTCGSAVSCLSVALKRPEAFVPDQRRAFVIILCSLSLCCLAARATMLVHILRVVY